MSCPGPRSPRMLLAIATMTACFGFLAACGGSTETASSSPSSSSSPDCITSFDAQRDYFPVKSQVTSATNFDLEYHRSYQVLTVKQPYPQGKPVSVVLVRCGAPKPHLSGDLATAVSVQTPIRSLYSASTTHLSLLADLARIDVLTGVSDATYITIPAVNAGVKDGRVAVYAKGGTVNVEKVVAAKPDVLMTGGAEDPAYPVLRKSGISVVPNAEWLESTALGRAEWIKVIAALTGTEQEAATVFDRVRDAYQQIAAKAASAAPTKVLPGTMYQGVWFMPAGGGYLAALIKDAGGSYPWADTKATGSLNLSFESVYAKSGEAKVWLVGQQWTTTKDALKDDPRYSKIAALQADRVWSSTKVTGPSGGNDFYQRGVTRPDLVLADLVAILHPDLLPDHEFAFYQKVPKQ